MSESFDHEAFRVEISTLTGDEILERLGSRANDDNFVGKVLSLMAHDNPDFLKVDEGARAYTTDEAMESIQATETVMGHLDHNVLPAIACLDEGGRTQLATYFGMLSEAVVKPEFVDQVRDAVATDISNTYRTPDLPTTLEVAERLGVNVEEVK